MAVRKARKAHRLNGGLNTRVDPSLIDEGQASVAVNVDYFDGFPQMRAGTDRVWATRPANGVVQGIYEFNQIAGAIRLVKVATVLYTWSLTPGTNPTSIKTALGSSTIATFSALNDLCFICDGTFNLVYDGTDIDEIGKDGAESALSIAASGTGLTGAYSYYFTRFSSILAAMEGGASALTAISLTNQGTSITSPGAFTALYDRVRIYRTQAGGTTYYLQGTYASGAFPVADTTADASLGAESTARITRSGATHTYEKPDAYHFTVIWNGRHWMANNTTNPSRLVWSEILAPTQFYDDSYHDLDASDGDEITGIVVFQGDLVIFKRNSIYIARGEPLDTLGFSTISFTKVFNNVGCMAPHSIQLIERAIYFLSDEGVRRFDGVTAPLLSEDIRPDIDNRLESRRKRFCSGYNELREQYWLALTTTSGSQNTKTLSYDLRTGAWAVYEWGMGNIGVSSMGIAKNNDALPRVYLGSADGYCYETEIGTDEGVTGGTKTGTPTSSTSTTVTDSTAAFRTTGDGLTGLVVTIYHAADATYESRVIASNTATQITVSSAWTSNPTTSDTYYIGAIEFRLVGKRDDFGRPDLDKRFFSLSPTWTLQTHAITLTVGWYLNASSTLSNSGAFTMNTDHFGIIEVDDRGVYIEPYFRVIGTDAPVGLLALTAEAEYLERRRR